MKDEKQRTQLTTILFICECNFFEKKTKQEQNKTNRITMLFICRQEQVYFSFLSEAIFLAVFTISA